MIRAFTKCLGFKSNRRRTVFLLLLCCASTVLFLYGSRPEDGHLKGVSDDGVQAKPEAEVVQKSPERLLGPDWQPNPWARDIPGSAKHLERHRVLLAGCRKKKNSDWLNSWPHFKEVPPFLNSPIISTKHRTLFCLVGKVASSFFTRWILTMNKPGPMTSPYLIPIEEAGRGRAESLKSLKGFDQQKKFLESSVKIVFGRDPFSRIFSAYIDKLYSPNPFYWKYWGDKALRDSRAPVTQCGSQVTFPQFVKLVTKTLAQKDVHLKQVAEECNMCRMYYDVIGKLETTVPDLDYASQLINISSQFQHDDDYKRAAQEDVVLDSLKSAFSWRKDIQKCIPLDQMGLRIWRKLQIRGVIDSAIQYPFQPGQIDSMSVDTFIEACKRAISESKDKDKLKRQKKQAMEEAYLSLTPDSINEILRAYSLDFSLFGYSERPDYLFNDEYKKQLNRTNFLAWDRPWNIH